jgi:hypothetical protein
MKEKLNPFSENIVEERIGDLIFKIHSETRKLGIKTLIVGSMGIAGLTGKYPKLYRGENNRGGFDCVDIDVLIGIPSGINLQIVKDCFDELWYLGMNSTYQIPVSPVNLPKEVANDPKAVLDFRWTLGKDIICRDRRGNKYTLPEDFVHPTSIKIYDQEAYTLSPEAQLAFKVFPGWQNPLRVIKDIHQLSNLILTNPLNPTKYKPNINIAFFDTLWQIAYFSSKQVV